LNGAIYLYFSSVNIADTLSFTLICVNSLLFFFYYNRTVGENDERDNISLQSNLIAKKITGKFVIVSAVIFIVSISLFYISMFSRIEVDDEGLKQYNLIEKDVTLCKYDEVEELITTNKDSKNVINVTFEEIIKDFLDTKSFKASYITYDEEIKFTNNVLYKDNKTERINNDQKD